MDTQVLKVTEQQSNTAGGRGGFRLGPAHLPVQLPGPGAFAPGQLFSVLLCGGGGGRGGCGDGGAAGEGAGQAHGHLEGLHAPVQA